MMKRFFEAAAMAAAVVMAAPEAAACTSMIVGRGASASWRPMLWKHRDTGVQDNFVARVDGTESSMAYVALFNAGDSLLREAWTGMNEAGFAIMNTASYNLAPDTAQIKDREGEVMRLALERCRSVDDFAMLLDTLPRPIGVQANFGVLDAEGRGAYFETDDLGYLRFDLDDDPQSVFDPETGQGGGIIMRTNFSFSGNDTDGMGYIRYRNACDILSDEIAERRLTPEAFTERASRSFYHSLMSIDANAPGHPRYAVDQDFIPRRISSASIVIEGLLPGESPDRMVMWTVIGYPPCSYVLPVTIDVVPEELLPTAKGWHSPLCDEVMQRRALAFPVTVGNGSRYVDLDYIDSISPEMRRLSAEGYRMGRERRENINTDYAY